MWLPAALRVRPLWPACTLHQTSDHQASYGWRQLRPTQSQAATSEFTRADVRENSNISTCRPALLRPLALALLKNERGALRADPLLPVCLVAVLRLFPWLPSVQLTPARSFIKPPLTHSPPTPVLNVYELRINTMRVVRQGNGPLAVNFRLQQCVSKGWVAHSSGVIIQMRKWNIPVVDSFNWSWNPRWLKHAATVLDSLTAACKSRNTMRPHFCLTFATRKFLSVERYSKSLKWDELFWFLSRWHEWAPAFCAPSWRPQLPTPWQPLRGLETRRITTRTLVRTKRLKICEFFRDWRKGWGEMMSLRLGKDSLHWI